ncbi:MULTISPECIES: dual specificity protein phosphatase [Pseudidiomarina]|uniref:Dual specificity protein phosphatase-like protein n=2 Tax=Pseudidiomarina TaxID=2800384 RepID=A0A368UNS8_9GAMM|nr:MULTISPECIES: dual specificity protein phosphatase [Pseudidiomarina]PWW11210.1 dual specificity protein phosphatase-like protein [Pseudidiomarina maritima]RBP88490.1 dual specificity protein phosphatase-like protein [Pseudidiomarina tainanensis]RCW30442.1 dual specificity protein phosphatase-like protein [Pseudidiomarina tainanensis]
MIEIHPNLFVGDEADASVALKEGDWYIIHACKEPFHRQALGYSGRAVPKNHPEYLIARRDARLVLNLVDVPDPAYIAKEIMDAAVEAIAENISQKKVLVHCNQGMSRSPTIALLYFLKHTKELNTSSLVDIVESFKVKYPAYNPAGGVAGFVERYWQDYLGQAH